MDLQKLLKRQQELYQCMESHLYSESYINKFRTEIKWITNRYESEEWSSYTDIYQTHEKISCSKAVLGQLRSILGKLEYYDIYGEFPDGTRKIFLIRKDRYHFLPTEFKGLVDFFKESETTRGKNERTVYREATAAVQFLYFMMNEGFTTLSDITEEAALSFFVSAEGDTLNTCYKGKIITVFRVGVSWKKECEKILLFLPKRHVTYNNIPYLTDNEVKLIRNAVDSDKKGLNLRDKAILMMLLYTGLRACDIASLEFESVDWEKDKIRIFQRKTDNPLELPLSAVVGNAIFSYLANGRPASNDKHVFLRMVRPYMPLSDSSVSVAVDKVCRMIGIRQNKGERRGTHIFRHKAATAMLKNNVSRPVISQLLGHTSPAAVNVYLHADFPNLKECALSIDGFPIAKGVFGE